MIYCVYIFSITLYLALVASAQRRITEHTYRFGRLSGITAFNTPSQPGAAPRQQTTMTQFGATAANDYGAKVVGVDAGTMSVVSRHGTPVITMSLPQPRGNIASVEPAFEFRYDFQGRIAERIDARGLCFRYFYDDLDRLALIEVGHYSGSQFTPGYPASMIPAGAPGAPSDRVQRVEYQYAPDQRSVKITAMAAGDAIVSQTSLEYDPNGSLVRDAQAHGELVTSQTPDTDYEWERRNADSLMPGLTRLSAMRYPTFSGVSGLGYHSAARRSINFDYAQLGCTSDQVGRIRRMWTDVADVSPSTIAAFQYVGTSRRARVHLAAEPNVWETNPSAPFLGRIVVDHAHSSNGDLLGYTAQGRIRELSFERPGSGSDAGSSSGGGEDLLRLSYSYDIGGSRLGARRWPSPHDQSATPTPARVETHISSHDVFSRLTRSALRHDIEGDQDPDGVLIRGDQWTLDALGNWDRRLIDPSDLPGDEYSERRSTDNRNRIVGITREGTPPAPPGAGGLPPQGPDAFAYDAAGNLVFDGTFLYQFDAWNRLVQINRAEYGTANRPTGPPDNPGEIEPIDPDELVVGPLVKHFTYDALGRLIRTQSPIPDPQTATTFNIPLPLRSERHYYDGIRRISTLTIDPLLPSVLVEGDPEPPGNDPPLDPQGLTLEAEAEQLAEGATPLRPIIIELPESLATLREWVWGPGDGYPGIDELLVQFDPQRKPIYIAQDASGDVVAAFDLGGTALQSGGLNGVAFPGGGSGNPTIPESLFTARRVWQASYDPYGQVIAARTEHAHDPVWAGHKGLFVERLDAGVIDGLPGLPTGLGGGSGIDLPRLAPGSTLIAHARNRWLLTRWGIWGSMDPNASGQGVVEKINHSGRGVPHLSPNFDLSGLYADGSNLAAYVHIRPLSLGDPVGLFGFDAAMNYAEAGFFIGNLAAQLVGTYSANMESDAEWALDWDLSDDMHTRGDASWIQDIYAENDVSQFVDDFANPLAGLSATGYSADYVKNSKKIGKLLINGVRFVGGHGHHAFFRTLTKWRTKVKEVIVHLPVWMHRDLHKFSDRRVRELVPGAPSIWHPGGEKVWDKFMGDPANKQAYFRALRRATQEWVKKMKAEGHKVEGLLEALDEAMGPLD